MRVAGLLAVLAFLVGMAWYSISTTPKIKPVDRTPAEQAANGPRLIYPDDQRHEIALANGQKKSVRSLLNISTPMSFGEFVWNDTGVPDGPSWIRVDLAGQTMSVFRAGHEIGSAVILYGTDGKPTPTGVFPVLGKKKHHRSNLYDAEMPFMLRLTYDGVAIHASNVQQGSATHGCIGVPDGFARRLFNQVKVGEPVSIIAGNS